MPIIIQLINALLLLANIIISFVLSTDVVPATTLFQHLLKPKAVAQQPQTKQNLIVKQLARQAPDLKPAVLNMALRAYQKANQQGLVKKPVLTVIDYSMTSAKKRLWVFDLKRKKVAYHTYVTHGRNSGNTYATRFSDRQGSHQSSLGVFITKSTYQGGKGYSLRLAGLERGFNGQALARNVVIHGAWYANQSFISRMHRAGLSWGCPAVPSTMAKPVINTIKNGSLIFAYYPDRNYLRHSKYVA